MQDKKRQIPLAKATSSLDANYNIRFSEKDETTSYLQAGRLHAQLYAAEHGYRDKYLKIYDSKTGNERINSSNIVAANLTFLYSDAPLKEGYIGDLEKLSLPIRVPIKETKYTFNVVDFFDANNFQTKACVKNKAKRNTTFNENIQSRIKSFSEYECFTKTTSALTTTKSFGTVVREANFHETFHHSEQAVMEFFSGSLGRKFITDSLNDMKAVTVGGLILDMYSTRYMCENCNVNIIGFQNTHKKGAIYDITRQLHNKRIDTPKDGILWSTRVSASKTGKGTKDAPARLTKDANKTHAISWADKHLILQADSNKLGLSQVAKKTKSSLDTYTGDFFTSREIAMAKMEGVLHKREGFK